MPLRYNLLSLPVQQAIRNGGIAGQRIVTAQRVLQSSSDRFLGSTTFGGRSYYIRQFRDMKESIKVNKLDYESFNLYCQICSTLLAIAHFQSPTAPMVRGYLKGQKALDYLHERGLDDETIKTFGLGLAPKDSKMLYNLL